MGFIMDGLDTEDYDRQYDDRELLKRVIGYFRPHAKQIWLVAAMLALHSVAGIGGPVMISKAIDVIAKNPSYASIALFSGGILALGISEWIFSLIRFFFSARVTGNVVLNMRKDVFKATINHDMSFFDEHPSGKIVSRVTSDTQAFSEVVNLILDLIGQGLLVGILLIWLFSIDVIMTLMMIGMIPFAALVALSFRKVARTVTQQARRVTAIINAQIQESISGIMIAKSFRRENAIYQSFDGNNKQAYHYGLRRGLVFSSIFPVTAAASSIGLAMLIYVGGLSMRNNNVSPGDWYLFMQGVGFVWFPMLSITSFWSQFQDGLSAAERVFALIDAEPKVVQAAAEPVEQLHGRIEFRDLSFRYTEKETVLSGFSLAVGARETLALVGHTGAGKSSIAKLIARFYEFNGGGLLIDGRDIRSLDLGMYRLRIGIVPQEPFLFSGTVADNIRYGNSSATDGQVMNAAMQIGNGDWIGTLSEGIETNVGERGASLSMGQRQLVALARVLLKDPAIFILDEATASVDPFTETQIKEGLETVMRDRTAIVIAHRLSTIRNADRIIVMQNGKIIEEGNHDGLMARHGHYAELYDTYFRHQTLEYMEDAGRVA